MPGMSTAERSPQATAMVVERAVVAHELLAEETQYEPFLTLEDDAGRSRVGP